MSPAVPHILSVTNLLDPTLNEQGRTSFAGLVLSIDGGKRLLVLAMLPPSTALTRLGQVHLQQDLKERCRRHNHNHRHQVSAVLPGLAQIGRSY